MTSEHPRVGALAAGATSLSMIALDLDHASQALELAKRFSENTGRAVTVRDADGEILGIFRGVVRN
jgi:hypothetical protein